MNDPTPAKRARRKKADAVLPVAPATIAHVNGSAKKAAKAAPVAPAPEAVTAVAPIAAATPASMATVDDLLTTAADTAPVPNGQLTIDEQIRRERHLVLRGKPQPICGVIPSGDVPHQSFLFIVEESDRQNWLSPEHRGNACPNCIDALAKTAPIVAAPPPLPSFAEEPEPTDDIVASVMGESAVGDAIAPPHPVGWLAMFANGTLAVTVAANRDLAKTQLEAMGHAVDPEDLRLLEPGDSFTIAIDPKWTEMQDRTPYVVPSMSDQLASRVSMHLELCALGVMEDA
jgi:hypothetical protein